MSEQFPKLCDAPVPGYVYVLAFLKILASPAPLRPHLASNNWYVPLVISAELFINPVSELFDTHVSIKHTLESIWIVIAT